MKQHEFIWKVSTNVDVSVIQTVNGITECMLKDKITLSHDYKRNNLILLVFEEFNRKFIVESDRELKEICKIVKENDNITQLLLDYAKNLTEMK